MSLKSKEKPRFLAFPHTVKFPVSPSNLKNLTASPGVKRARKPSVYFFGTFFVQAKKVHTVPHTHGSQEGAHTLRVLFWYFFRTSEKSAAMCRSNFRGRASKNNKFNLPRKQARLRGINSTAQTQTSNQNPYITKTQKFHKTPPVLARSR